MPVAVADGRLMKVPTQAVGHSILEELLYPGARILPGDAPVTSIEVLYPSGGLRLFGLSVHWLVAYFLLSIVFGFALKGMFKVEI